MKILGKVRMAVGVDKKRGPVEQWVFDCPPHVRMRVKAVFDKVDDQEWGLLKLNVTPETCRDVQWFLDRYPMDVEPFARQRMDLGARLYTERLDALERMLGAEYLPREFGLAKPLREYQARGVEIFLKAGGLLLGDDLGLGKSVTALGALSMADLRPAVIICPTHLTRQWQNFLGEFLPTATHHTIKQMKAYPLPAVDVIICAYSKLRGWGGLLGLRGLRSVIFDEVQELRRADTEKYKAAMMVREGVAYAMGLSATPIYNYGGEAFNIFEMLAPGKLGGRAEFNREWCYGGGDKWILNDARAFGAYLRDQFLMLRRTRADVGMELPATQLPVVTVPHTPKALQDIKGSALELARKILAGSFEESGQAAREFDRKMRQATGLAKAPYVADFVRMLIEGGQPKVLLFGWHREVYDVWLEKLKDLHPVLYTGSETAEQKAVSVRKFLETRAWDQAKVMIMSLRSGVGVDGLQAVCSTAVFGELDWSPGVHEQCVGRLNRDGGLNEGVIAYYLVADAGSDPVVSEVLGIKREQVAGIKDPMLEPKELSELQVDPERVKLLARKWLEMQGEEVPERAQKSEGSEVSGQDSESLQPPACSYEGVGDEDEELVRKCLEVMREERKASTSLFQRRLRLGYTRAARILEILEARGYVGPGEGAKPRDILRYHEPDGLPGLDHAPIGAVLGKGRP